MSAPAFALCVLALLTAGVVAQAPDDLVTVLGRVGDRVLHYYSRAQSIVCLERVMVQPIGSDLTPQGFARVIESELRVEWEAGLDGAPPEATVHREIRKVNGRPARPGNGGTCEAGHRTGHSHTGPTRSRSEHLPTPVRRQAQLRTHAP